MKNLADRAVDAGLIDKDGNHLWERTQMKVEIYGASDDLIEIEGDIREEFNPSEDDGILAFSDGTILRVSYDNDGMWRIAPIAVGSAVYEMVQGTDPDNDYSDHAWLTGDIEWVVFGSQYAKVKS